MYQFFLNSPFGEPSKASSPTQLNYKTNRGQTMASQSSTSYYQSEFKFNDDRAYKKCPVNIFSDGASMPRWPLLDTETGLYYYGARYYDPSLSVWLSVDPHAKSYPNIGGYVYAASNPINVIDPDGRDIIVLQARNDVAGLGHAAVLIWNDVDGWKYVSKNGTSKDIAGRFGSKGPSKNPNLGALEYISKTGVGDDFTKSGLNIYEIFDVLNNKRGDKQKYTGYFRIKSTTEQDHLAYGAAVATAIVDYDVVGSSCVDVCQNALENTGISFNEPSFYEPRPNIWIEKFQKYNWYNQELTPITRNKTAILEVGELTIKGIHD